MTKFWNWPILVQNGRTCIKNMPRDVWRLIEALITISCVSEVILWEKVLHQQIWVFHAWDIAQNGAYSRCKGSCQSGRDGPPTQGKQVGDLLKGSVGRICDILLSRSYISIREFRVSNFEQKLHIIAVLCWKCDTWNSRMRIYERVSKISKIRQKKSFN